MKIYVASSWRNTRQPLIVTILRSSGHEVYDFRNPKPNDTGFHWAEINHSYQNWSPSELRKALKHPIAEAGFKSDFNAMHWADCFVGVMPFGRSASLEMGWAAGAGKKTILLLDESEPELMIKMLDHLCININEMLEALK